MCSAPADYGDRAPFWAHFERNGGGHEADPDVRAGVNRELADVVVYAANPAIFQDVLGDANDRGQWVRPATISDREHPTAMMQQHAPTSTCRSPSPAKACN
jgi:hypothetical protein